MPGLLHRIGDLFRLPVRGPDNGRPTARAPLEHNLFDAAATYVVACIDDDQDRIDEAAGRVAPDALMFGVNELAQRAVLTLAREHGAEPESVARRLLGLPTA
ncbi:hypothetical protein QMK19_17560 [Streptomyces sp. H10-C2]|uniref:hypothetical protein n=1 Tax=unclassified Streptomyces TaxID=2593676 RepID=UPI0024B9C147|nr:MULTISPECIES: hypothetical protein [unclassified Streptomyces]MDJ0342997.1 hypothetical protein [Streptomyces sp. PH10-H1]MDJ0371442.1 hypothetical protein [Streptomyces sp. H10-C2]